MNNKTLIFFVDAVRKDYITKENSPFLYDFMKNKTYMDCISQLGYSSGIHPSIFKGKDQENHNHFLVYSYAD
jgi:predicted AlkP superfamily pyrophosphatase or phosphodiesterase